MVIQSFPDPSYADEHGLLAIGGDLEVESLLLAYKNGIFPWPISKEYLTWFAPPKRALLFVAELHLSKSLRKFLKNHPYTITVNQHFEQVIEHCSEPVNRGDQDGTWITSEIMNGYIDLFRAGHAYSIECHFENSLVGGLYGVKIGGMVSGESMFYRKPNASKVCLHYLTQALQQHSIPWLDCQVMTPLLESFGAREVERDEYMKLLQIQLTEPTLLFCP